VPDYYSKRKQTDSAIMKAIDGASQNGKPDDQQKTDSAATDTSRQQPNNQ